MVMIDHEADLYLRPFGMTKYSFLNIHSNNYGSKYPECTALTNDWLKFWHSQAYWGKVYKSYLAHLKVKEASGPSRRPLLK